MAGELKILALDQADKWEQQGYIPRTIPRMSPGPCPVCGVADYNCTGHEYAVPSSPIVPPT